MELLEFVLLAILLVSWLLISIAGLVATIQSVIYDHKREKREKERDARDAEYHEKRMGTLK